MYGEFPELFQGDITQQIISTINRKHFSLADWLESVGLVKYDQQFIDATVRSGTYLNTMRWLVEKKGLWSTDTVIKEVVFRGGSRPGVIRWLNKIRPRNVGKWYQPTSGVYMYVSNQVRLGDVLGVVGYDLVGTLIDGPYNLTIPSRKVDMLYSKLLTGTIPVIFTNQITTDDEQTSRVINDSLDVVTRQLTIPVILMMATKEDSNAKPNTGMWEVLVGLLPGYARDPVGFTKKSSYIGQNTEENTQFARNIGVKFYDSQDRSTWYPAVASRLTFFEKQLPQ